MVPRKQFIYIMDKMNLYRSSTMKLTVEQVKCSIPEMDSFTYNLPNTFIEIVFDHLPLEDLLHCNLVCRQWNDLYRAACARRRKLTLVISSPRVDESNVLYKYTFNSYPFAIIHWDDKGSSMRHSWLKRRHWTSLNNRLVNGLRHNFANITSLVFILMEIPTKKLDYVAKLLNFWAEKLTSLKLHLDFEWPSRAEMVKLACNDPHLVELVKAINSLSNLTHLTLEHMDRHKDMSLYEKNSNNEPILVLQLENLKEFNYASRVSLNVDTRKAIFRYVESHSKLRSIGFAHSVNGKKQTKLLLSCNAQVASRITQLYLLESHSVTVPQLTRICKHFCNVTTLQLDYPYRCSVSQLTKALAQCRALKFLIFSCVINGALFTESEPISRENITQLSSIKWLSLALSVDSHVDLKAFELSWIYPNLEMIELTDLLAGWFVKALIPGCSICGKLEHISERRPDHCRKLLLSPLKELQHLKVIKYRCRDNAYEFYSKEDL